MKTIELFDSEREVSFEEIKDHCEANEIPVPEEDSDKWWDIVNDIREWDCDDFRSDACYHFDLGLCLVKGYAGLWNGNAEGGKVMRINSANDLFFMDVDRVRVTLEDDGLVVYGYHHDGTNRYVVYQLTERGEKFIENHEDELSPRELHDRLIKAHLVKRVTKKLVFPKLFLTPWRAAQQWAALFC